MSIRAAVAVLVVALAADAAGQAPVTVVERVVTQGEVATRVSLFSNGVVVVTQRRQGAQVLMRRLRVPDDRYLVYLGLFQESASNLDENPVTSRVDTSHAEVVLSLHVGPDAPRIIRFSPVSTVKLPLARIQAALDDLQQQALEASPSADAIRAWQPREGDRVELLNGTVATVVEVWDDGLLFLVHDQTYIRESVSPDLRDQVILRVLETSP